MDIGKEEAEHKMRFIEMLLIVTSILVGMGKIQIEFTFFMFFVSAILYYIFVSNSEELHGKLDTFFPFLTSMSFSGITILSFGVMFSGFGWLGIFEIMSLFFAITIILFFALNSYKSNKALYNSYKNIYKKYFQHKKKK